MAYDSHAIRANVDGMGTPISAIVHFWRSNSNKVRAAVAALATLAVVAFGWVIEQVAGDAVAKLINDVFLSWWGPLLPHVWQVIASNLLSILAAAGLLWLSLSWGYWLGLRDPQAAKPTVSAGPVADTAPGTSNSAQIQQGRERQQAREAAREISHLLETAERRASGGYGRDREQNHSKALNEFRPTIIANIRLVQRIGMPMPDFSEFDSFEAGHLTQFLKEVQPFLDRALYPEAAARAAEETERINKAIAGRHRKT